MKYLIDYIAYRLYYVYLRHKDPDPQSAVTYVISLAVSSFVYFLCTFVLRIIFCISIRDVYPEDPRLSLGIYIFGIMGIVYWRVKKKYTEKYITTTLTSKFQDSKYNKKIKGWMIIVACLLCFFAFGISASIIV
ncbi:hypothetical protein HQ47_08370 [Porphyromonas macacae]|uniref:Uncharacterized protein n=1 Tax=Porphyromonas macacae TaxID=28115 RepID=A0A0A2E3N6_9PORP|nr:hypothetical protein HQ47_08370 [Porphyromonas macacae]